MNVCSLYLYHLNYLNIKAMKTSILLKAIFLLPFIFIVDYLLMITIGCTTCLFGVGEGFYCGTYCIIGKSILGLSLIFLGYLLYPDFKKLVKTNSNAKTAQEPQS